MEALRCLFLDSMSCFGTGRSSRKMNVNLRGIPAFCCVFSSNVHTICVSAIRVDVDVCMSVSLRGNCVILVDP